MMGTPKSNLSSNHVEAKTVKGQTRAPESIRLLARCYKASRVIGYFGVGIGLLVIIGGWGLNIALLRAFPGYAAMAPAAALGILLTGTALLLRATEWPAGSYLALASKPASHVCIAGVLIIGTMRLWQQLAGIPAAYGRMTTMAAATFICLAVALALLEHRRAFEIAQYLVISAGVMCLANTIVYAFGVHGLSELPLQPPGTPMALQTSLTLTALCAGILLSRPLWGLVSIFSNSASGGALVRRLLPACVMIPVVSGWLAWQGEFHGLYGRNSSLALLTLAVVLGFTFLAARSGHELNRLDTARESAERGLRQLADAMPQIVWTADGEGNIDYYNRRWYDYTGMSFDQTRNWGWQPVIHPDDLALTIERWTGALASHKTYEVECRFKRASDSGYRWHLARASYVQDEQDGQARWFGTSTDIDDFKQAEEKVRLMNEELEDRVKDRTAALERANREMQEFVAVASHDMQEPVRKVQAFGDRLKTIARDSLNEQSRDYLDRMLSSSRRMQSLIQDLLRFSRLSSRHEPFAKVDLGQVARCVLSDLAVEIAESGAQIESGPLPVIEAGGTQMRQLLENLIGNALKFRKAGQPPSIRFYGEEMGSPNGEPMLRLVIKDDGIGFDERHLDRIFTVFQRLHGRTEYEGTGVGLAICRRIVQQHRGQITARSAPGEGAAFMVTLPMRQTHTDELTAGATRLHVHTGAITGELP